MMANSKPCSFSVKFSRLRGKAEVGIEGSPRTKFYNYVMLSSSDSDLIIRKPFSAAVYHVAKDGFTSLSFKEGDVVKVIVADEKVTWIVNEMIVRQIDWAEREGFPVVFLDTNDDCVEFI